MTTRTKSTLKMLCVKTTFRRKEVMQEAQKLLDVYEDPNTSPEEKERVKKILDEKIAELENRVTTRRMREARKVAGA